MEDLHEVGKKVIAAIGDLGATNAGDLVLGIGALIDELRGQPDCYEEKLDHLEGLFREFAYGQEYALREKFEDKEEDDYFGGFGGFAASGLMNTSPIQVSGYPLNLSGTLSTGMMPPSNHQIPMPPGVKPPKGSPIQGPSSNPPINPIPAPVAVHPTWKQPEVKKKKKKKKPKVFKPAWWKTKT